VPWAIRRRPTPLTPPVLKSSEAELSVGAPVCCLLNQGPALCCPGAMTSGITVVILAHEPRSPSPTNCSKPPQHGPAHGLAAQRIYRTALAAFAAHAASLITEQLDAVHGATPAGGLDPLLARLQGASLVREDW
jgi:hypothetical protein